MTKISKLTAALLVGISIAAMPVHAETAKSTKAAYSVKETTLGVLLDDPVSNAIIARLVPVIINHPQVQVARALTLVQLQGFAGDILTDPVLSAIEANLREAAPKR